MKEIMEIIGKIIFMGGFVFDVFLIFLYLMVKFEDVSLMDVFLVKIGELVVDVINIYMKGELLIFIIKCFKLFFI